MRVLLSQKTSQRAIGMHLLKLVLKELNLAIPVAAVVKDEKHRPREVIGAQRAHLDEADAVLEDMLVFRCKTR